MSRYSEKVPVGDRSTLDASGGIQIGQEIDDAISALREVCQLTEKQGGGWRKRGLASDALVAAIQRALWEQQKRGLEEFDEGMRCAASVCRDVAARKDIDDPRVFAALHESEAMACSVAILSVMGEVAE